jgi:hypothetical protein
MPQFDKLTFLSQLFWVLIFFLTLYFIVLRYALPACSTSLKVRKKTVLRYAQLASRAQEEGASIFAGSEKVLCESVARIRAALWHNQKLGASWLVSVAKGINGVELHAMNKEFVLQVGQMVGKTWLAMRAVRRTTSEAKGASGTV